MATQQHKVSVALLSVLSNSLLVLFKLIVGISIGSVSVISEALHSGVDLLASVIAFFAVRLSGQPADERHPFGHEKLENFSGTIEALLIFVAAGWIIYEAIRRLLHPHPLESVFWGVAVMLVSSVANIIVSHMLFKIGKATDSVALLADAWHLRTDVWTSAGVFAGLALLWAGQALLPGANLLWIDPLAALLVAILIVKAAWDLTLSSALDLLDVSLPAAERAWIVEYVDALGTPVRGMHDLRTRKAGHRRFIEFHLEVEPHLSVEESHGITERIDSEISNHFPHSMVTVHVEPSGNGDGCRDNPDAVA
jgi:cation diffusion facilitator family transporter